MKKDIKQIIEWIVKILVLIVLNVDITIIIQIIVRNLKSGLIDMTELWINILYCFIVFMLLMAMAFPLGYIVGWILYR